MKTKKERKKERKKKGRKKERKKLNVRKKCVAIIENEKVMKNVPKITIKTEKEKKRFLRKIEKGSRQRGKRKEKRI